MFSGQRQKLGFEGLPAARAPRLNNIDITRLGLATLVYVGHYGWIFPDSPIPRQTLAFFIGHDGQRCVQAFFVLSGYLMYLSFEHSDGIFHFYERRFRRIYPAYFTVIFLSAIFGLWFSSLSLREYISFDFLRYILWNLSFLNFMHPTLPGVFENQPIHFVNGPLWTLKIEVGYYVLFPLIFVIGRLTGYAALFVALYCLSVIYHTWMSELANQSGLHIYEVLAVQLPGQLAYFVAGSAVASWTQGHIGGHIKRYSWLNITATVLALVCLWYSGLNFFLPISIAAFVLCFCLLGPRLGGWLHYGDWSYGVYIIHFPVLQALRSIDVLHNRQGILFIPATIIIYSLSFIMWRLVESPSLKGRWTKRSINSGGAMSSHASLDLCSPNLPPNLGSTATSKIDVRSAG